MTFEAILALVRRYALWFIGIVLVVLAITAAYTFLQTPRYEAFSRVIIEPRTQTVLPTEDVLGGLPSRDTSVVDTEVEALYSVDLAERVVRDLGLMDDPEFQRLVDGKPDLERTANAVIGNISIRRAGQTYLIDIVAESIDALKATKLANSYAANYIQLQKDTKRAATQQATDLLAERIDEMAAEVESAERAVQQYRIANGLMSVNGATLAEQSISQIDNDLARARAEEREALGRLAAAQGAGYRTDAAQSPALEQLRTQLAIAEQQLREAQLKYGPRHPNFQSAQARVEEINRSIATETGRAQSSLRARRDVELDRLRAEAAAASQKRASLSGSVGSTRGTLASTNAAQVELNRLMRDASAVRSTYEAYLNRYQETTTKLGTEQADARIVSDATLPPTPTLPNKKLNLALGGLLGAALAVSIIVGFIVLDSRLSTPDEIERLLDLNALPSLPTLQSTFEKSSEADESEAPEQYVIVHPQSLFAEQFRNLRAAIQAGDSEKKVKVVGVTSSLPNEGKTTTSICLARMAALSGLRTILVDCDIRHRSVNRLFGEAVESGLAEHLNDGTALSDSTYLDDATGLTILPISTGTTPASEVVTSQKMADLIGRLRDQYDLVVLDLPPVLPLADARFIATWADATAVLCRWRSTPRRALENALEILADAEANIVGVALSLVDLKKQARQGYGDPTFYYSKYKHYYSS